MLVVCLLLLWQVSAGGRPSGPTATGSPSPSCAPPVSVAFVTDVSGLGSSAEAEGWLGAQRARQANPCIQLELVTSRAPSDYRPNLQRAADRHADLVVAASFLLTEAATEAARDNPKTRFILVDPQAAPAPADNLASLMVRRGEAGYLAGALAGMLTRSNVVGSVYGLGGEEPLYQQGFRQGAASTHPGVQLLVAIQGPQDGVPSRNPVWGAAGARSLIGNRADVIFAAVGTTGQGALDATAQTGAYCIGVESDVYLADLAARGCLVTSAVIHIDRMVELTIASEIHEAWSGGGHRSFGVADGVITLAPFRGRGAALAAEVRQRLDAIENALSNGTLLSQY